MPYQALAVKGLVERSEYFEEIFDNCIRCNACRHPARSVIAPNAASTRKQLHYTTDPTPRPALSMRL